MFRSDRIDSRSSHRDAGRSQGHSAARANRLGRPWCVKKDRERWNDWGIGLLLQGDLKGAEYAFRKVTEAEPGYADGWLNVARALIQEGETDAAKPYIAKALEIAPQFGRTWFFKAAIQKADGDYDGALQSLDRVRSQYPRDRVVLNQIARLLFLKREYAQGHRSVAGRKCGRSGRRSDALYVDAGLLAAWATRPAPSGRKNYFAGSKRKRLRRR